MFKKVFAGIVLVGLSAVLVAGAINRTSDRLERSDTQRQESRSGNLGRNADGGNAVQGGSGRGFEGGDQGASLTQVEGGNGYGRGRTANASEATLVLNKDESEHHWLQFEGAVSSVDADALTVNLDSGELILVEGRAWSFTQEMGFTAEAGDRVALDGFFEDGDFEVGELTNLTSGQKVLLREASGRPLWAGRGRRAG